MVFLVLFFSESIWVVLFTQDSRKEPTKKKKKKKKKDAPPKVEIGEEKEVEEKQEEQTELPCIEEKNDFEAKEEDAPAINEDSEQEEDVFPSAYENSRDARSAFCNASDAQDGSILKTSVSSLLSDEWQPRRSERIFINSSVTTNSSSSPLSPSNKGGEFLYNKKSKKGSVSKRVRKSLNFFLIGKVVVAI